MRQTIRYILVALAIIVVVHSAANAIAQESQFKRGDRVAVVPASAELKVAAEVVARLSKGQELTVTSVKGQWVGCSLKINEEVKTGWLPATALSLTPSNEKRAAAPTAAVHAKGATKREDVPATSTDPPKADVKSSIEISNLKVLSSKKTPVSMEFLLEVQPPNSRPGELWVVAGSPEFAKKLTKIVGGKPPTGGFYGGGGGGGPFYKYAKFEVVNEGQKDRIQLKCSISFEDASAKKDEVTISLFLLDAQGKDSNIINATINLAQAKVAKILGDD